MIDLTYYHPVPRRPCRSDLAETARSAVRRTLSGSRTKADHPAACEACVDGYRVGELMATQSERILLGALDRMVYQPVVQVAAADELIMGEVGTVIHPRMAANTRVETRLGLHRRIATVMSTRMAITAASRPWRPRGVPTPSIDRSSSPRLKAPAWISTRLRIFS